MTTFTSLAPVLPVRDVTAALELCLRLGFRTRAYDGPAAYGYAERGAYVDPDGNLLRFGSRLKA
jgi:hypothetical protein